MQIVHLILQVQLNIRPVNKDGHQKINIIDVLKIDPDEETFADKNGVDSADENSSSNMVKNLYKEFTVLASLKHFGIRLSKYEDNEKSCFS